MKRVLLYLSFIIVIIGIWSLSHFEAFGKGAFKPDSANVLIAGLAFAGVIIGLFQQQAEIQMQRDDLELQRDEMRLTRDEIKQQNDTFKIQRFENTFFNMLTLHHDIVNHIDVAETSDGWQNGLPIEIMHSTRDAFKYTYNKLKKDIEIKLILHDNEMPIEVLNELFIEHYKVYKTDFGHYFRNLYRIFKTIDENVFDVDKIKNFMIQYKYTSIVRSQLSDFELLWLYYNGLSENGSDKFKPIIEKYTVLKNLPFDEIPNPNSKSWYLRTARRKPVDISLHLDLMQSKDPFNFYQENKLQLFDIETLEE
jgi:hypothetical protein